MVPIHIQNETESRRKRRYQGVNCLIKTGKYDFFCLGSRPWSRCAVQQRWLYLPLHHGPYGSAVPAAPGNFRNFPKTELRATTQALQDLVNFMSTQWIKSSTFSPSSWSVYGQPVRTNNDIEVWQNALNRRACSRVQLPFYLLIQLLHRESAVCTVQVRIVFMENLKVWNWSSLTFHYLYVTRLTFYLHVERDSRHPFTRVFVFVCYC